MYCRLTADVLATDDLLTNYHTVSPGASLEEGATVST